jgi:hypothetical protein
MLKRLLIAVLVLSLVTAFTGTAFSDVKPNYAESDARPINSHVDNAPYDVASHSIHPVQVASRATSNEFKLPAGAFIPAPPLDNYCEDLEYDLGPDVYFTLSAPGYGTEDLFNVRYTTEENYSCTLYQFTVLPYQPAMVGTPDLMVYLYADDGIGNPGAVLDSALIPYADLTTFSWKYVDFSPTSPNAPVGGWVFENGEEYHYAVQVRDNSGVGTDQVAILLDDGTSGFGSRTTFWDTYGGPGTWVTYLGAFLVDRAMVQSSINCCGEIPYTDCYYQEYHSGLSAIWNIPDPVEDIQEIAQRFSPGGYDTLVSIDVLVYDLSDGNFGLDDIIVTVYDDAAGFPGAVLWTGTIPAGTYAFPWATINVGGLVLNSDFHIGVKSDLPAFTSGQLFGSDDGSEPAGRSSVLYNGTWQPSANAYSDDLNFYIDAFLCRDQFNTCKNLNYSHGAAGLRDLASAFREKAAVKIFADGINCQVNEVGWLFYPDAAPYYTHDTKISVYTDNAGLPGTEIASVILAPGDITNFYPAYQSVDFNALDVYVDGEYWIVCESDFIYDTLVGSNEGVVLVTDDGTFDNEGRSAQMYPTQGPNSGVWITMLDRYGFDYGWNAYSSHCCIPRNDVPRTCDPVSDAGWSTQQGNQQRTGASMLAVGDAWCNLNLNWSYQGAEGITYTGPTIYGDRAVCSFSDRYVVFDIITGTPIYTIDNSVGDGFLMGNGISVAPTIANIGGTDMMFIGGGSSLGFGAIDFNTGALLWQNTLMSGAGIFGKTSYTTTTVLNIGGTDVVYHTTDNGNVVALEAATGALFSGWVINPVGLTYHPFASGATDGTDLYYATQDAGSDGDMFSIDASTGNINWQLSGAGGLAASGAAGYNGYPEGFRGGVAFDNGVLYANSWANENSVNEYPIGGFLYMVKASDGSLVIPAISSMRSQYSTPLVDAFSVYITGFPHWASPSSDGNLAAYHRSSGALLWSARSKSDAAYYTSGLLTCEPDAIGAPAPDLMFVFNTSGFFECYETATGSQLFTRRVEHDGTTAEDGMAGALAMTATDGMHMLASDFGGGLYDLKLGADRPRLEMQTFRALYPVEFGPDPALAVNIGPVMVNTGCADLNILSTQVDENAITISALPLFSSVGYVSEDVMDRASKIADALQRDAFLSKFRLPREDVQDALRVTGSNNSEKLSSRSSAAIPAWFVSLDHPIAGDLLAPGDTMDLEITVNQPLISRGPQTVFIAWGHDDPDYFLNEDATLGGKLPELMLTIVGGCLIDTTTLTFGMGGANVQLVTNTGRLGTGDWTPHGYAIDGDGGSFYQGAYVYGVDTFRVATNSQDWLSGGTTYDNEDAVWKSLQADPNFCDNSCKPALTAAVAVGALTNDGGLTYDPITADMVCKTFVDSVTSSGNTIDPATVGSFGWSDWADLNFDDTLTMGLIVNTRTFGVSDVPQLNNLTLEILEFTERNGDSLPGWYFGQMTDYDVGGDVATMDQSISAAWAYTAGGTNGWGEVKIPFGCGTLQPGQDFDYNPLRSIKELTGDQGFYYQDGVGAHAGGAYWDSCYMWLSLPNGTIGTPQTQTADFEMHSTFAAHDFGPNETYTIGIANFGFGDRMNNSSASDYADLAHFVNKWAGFGRGDVNDDGSINLADIIYLAANINNGGPGAVPFAHLSDVNADGSVDAGDITYLIDYYFNCGPCPMGDWMF